MREEGIEGAGEVGDGDPLQRRDGRDRPPPDQRGHRLHAARSRPRAGCGATSSSARGRRRACRSQHVVVDLERDGLPFDVTLVVANQTVAGRELIDHLKDARRRGPAPLHHRRAAGHTATGMPSQEARERLRTLLASLRGRGHRGRGHDRRPRSLHRGDERAAVLPHLRDRRSRRCRRARRSGSRTSSSSASPRPTSKPVEHVEVSDRRRPRWKRAPSSRRARARGPARARARAPRPAAGQPLLAGRPAAARDAAFHHLGDHGLRGLLHGLLLHPGRGGRRLAGARATTCRS